MKITPFGKKKEVPSLSENDSSLISTAQNQDKPVNESYPDSNRIIGIQKNIKEVLKTPSLDKLMQILTSLGMGKISLSLSEDGSVLRVSGVINLTNDGKITKKD